MSSWSAKPSGPYDIGSPEWRGNVLSAYQVLQANGYTQEAAAAMMGNAHAESGLNPWRWQGDAYNPRMGYGLFQFTPAEGYFSAGRDLLEYGPNLSTTSVTAGAKPEDGTAQVFCVVRGTPAKWVPTCWRPYWSQTEYADLYARRKDILTKWGSPGGISQAQFSQITSVEDAAFVFLACYEGPSVPNYTARAAFSRSAYNVIIGGGGETLPPWLIFILSKRRR